MFLFNMKSQISCTLSHPLSKHQDTLFKGTIFKRPSVHWVRLGKYDIK